MQALRFDFVRARPRHAPMAWLLLALGLLGAAMALAELQDVHAQWQQAQQAVERVASAPRPRSGPAGNAGSDAVPPERARATARAQAALERPWGALLRALEVNASDQVALLSFDAASGPAAEGRLRLIGEARGMAEVLAYVEALRAAPPVRKAELSHHEAREVEGQAVLRFSIDVDWGGATP